MDTRKAAQSWLNERFGALPGENVTTGALTANDLDAYGKYLLQENFMGEHNQKLTVDQAMEAYAVWHDDEFDAGAMDDSQIARLRHRVESFALCLPNEAIVLDRKTIKDIIWERFPKSSNPAQNSQYADFRHGAEQVLNLIAARGYATPDIERLNILNKALGQIAPKGYWFAEVLEKIWHAKTMDEAMAIAQDARKFIDATVHGTGPKR